MGSLKRGWRNVYRSEVRAVLVSLLVGLSVAVFLTLTQAASGVAEQARRLGGEVQTLIEVRAAGATGMGAGLDALPEEFFERAQGVGGIRAVEPYLFQRLIDESKPASIAIVVGTVPGQAQRVASHGEVGSLQIVAGRGLQPGDEGRPVALVGRVFAEQYGLKPGDRFTIPKERAALEDRPDPNVKVDDLTLEVVGIFQSGFVFGDNQLFVPLSVVQDAHDQEGKISHIFVTAASVDQVDEVEKALRQAFDNEADIISGQATAQTFARTLAAVEANSRKGALVAVILAGAVVLATMVLTTRERTREIGVLKAIGASNGHVAAQFVAETVSLSLLASVVGLILYFAAGSALGTLLLQRLGGELLNVTAMGGGNPAAALAVGYGFSPATLAYSIGVILLLALVGSLYPVVQSVRLQPAEAIRFEG